MSSLEILIVEDDKDFADSVAEMLVSLPFN